MLPGFCQLLDGHSPATSDIAGQGVVCVSRTATWRER
jgi:hypothetical protein